MDEDSKIRQFVAGNADALCELVDAHRASLFSFILHMTGGRDDADEIFQEVWIKALQALPRYEHRQRFASWLFKIAHRTIIDRSRRKKNVSSFDHGIENLDLPHTADHRTPFSSLANHELGHTILAAVNRLPDAQKEVFLLRMEADFSFKEIARIQKTSINTALARMAYALEKLRDQLGNTYREMT
ncbi:MAG: sigma-70 family RNA polymerase sigma factor [Kiritimatiellia bacterium]